MKKIKFEMIRTLVDLPNKYSSEVTSKQKQKFEMM